MAAAFAVLPLAAQAQGFQLGARLGYAFGMGDVGGSVAMSDWQSSNIPIQLDAMFRLNKNVAIGGYFSYAYGFVAGEASDACDADGADCSARTMRLGAQVTYAFDGKKTWVPWLGAGIGYEWNKITEEVGGASADVTVKGWEYLNLQGGADYKVNQGFSIGPYLMFSIGKYGTMEVEGAGSGDINDTAMHEWLSFGVRGTFNL
jgi:hypothetical protein